METRNSIKFKLVQEVMPSTISGMVLKDSETGEVTIYVNKNYNERPDEALFIYDDRGLVKSPCGELSDITRNAILKAREQLKGAV